MDRLAAATCAVIAIAAPICFGQSGSGSMRPSGVQQGNERRVDEARPKLLVLNNGRVVGGIITPRPGGYDIRKPVGTLFIASTTVRFEATDMADAYRKMRGTFNELTPETHIEIARWCLANNQLPAARQELLDALHLEPRNDKARSMLKRLEARAVPKTQPRNSKTLAQRRIDHFMRSEHESLGGLTDKQAATFVGRVQPIFEKNCASTSCHGSGSTTDFILKRSRGHSSRLVSERNLAVVLKQIDFKQPEKSPVLRVLDEPHTRDGRPVLSGRGGTVQKKIILDWVHSVVTKDGTRPVAVDEVRLASVKSTAAPPSLQKPDEPVAATRALTTTEQALIREVRASNEDDPFDPADFNRKHHGFKQPGGAKPKR